MSKRKQRLLAVARAALRIHQPRSLTPEQALKLARKLKALSLFNYAAAVLQVTLAGMSGDHPRWKKMVQQQALCTYQDRTQGVHERLMRAMELIESLDLSATTDQETLGIAGSICRRRWELGGRREDLEQSAVFYCRGEALGIEGDDGYTAINAAFVLDLLASETKLEGTLAASRDRADKIRQNLVDALPARIASRANSSDAAKWWIVATLIEACFALGRYKEAENALASVDLSRIDTWERESTVQRLAAITRLHAGRGMDPNPAWNWINRCFPTESPGLRQSALGKVGLALSGGGFRASLFHLGVLARLAELDVLRHVEVISTVSGGSIVGAYYYLAVRNLLQTREDSQISSDDYLKLVQNCIDQMMSGIRKNIRTHSLADAAANFNALFDPQSSRTDRIASLYNEHFYAHSPGAKPGEKIMMRDLTIIPAGCTEQNFFPHRDNWRRRNKVPTLVLNATALNTGHNWQFTPEWMGESRHHINNEIDANYHLRRMYYDEAPASHRQIQLSRAVAASSCVPGLFPPVRLISLYEGKLVALVDGAIHDNQGIASLLAEDCSIVLVSDGAGHIRAADFPALHVVAVAQRSMSVVQTRLRELQHRELTAWQRGSMLHMRFLHLKKGLAGSAVPWIGCDTRPLTTADEAEPDSASALTDYGVLKQIPPLLANMRTDLDSFSDLEAYALMYDGYQLATNYVADMPALSASPTPRTHPWPFLAVAPMMQGKEGSDLMLKHLRAGQSRLGKLLKVPGPAKLFCWSAITAGVVAILILLAAMWNHREFASVVWTSLLVVLLIMVGLGVGVFLAAYLYLHSRRWNSPDEPPPSKLQLGIDVLVLLIGWIPARLYLLFGNDAFLQAGEVRKSK